MFNNSTPAAPALLGILVGGRGSRMGGVPKGLLRAPSGKSIVESLVDEFHAVSPGSPVVLLGEHEAYMGLSLTQLADTPPGCGPMGGVHALLRVAAKEQRRAVLVGCDMPYLDRQIFAHLLHAQPAALALAPRRDGHWEPLCSRYEPSAALPALAECLAAQRHSLQGWLTAMGTSELSLSAAQLAQFRDWDTPDDINS